MTQTPVHEDVTKSAGETLYDGIMATIEPDLTMLVLPTLEEKYRGESAKKKAARMARYEQAFARYDEIYTTYVRDMDEEVHACKVLARRFSEADEARANLSTQQHLLFQMESV